MCAPKCVCGLCVCKCVWVYLSSSIRACVHVYASACAVAFEYACAHAGVKLYAVSMMCKDVTSL